jgi:hypothetical protein
MKALKGMIQKKKDLNEEIKIDLNFIRVFFPNFIITLVLSLLGDKQMRLLIV